MNGEKEEVIYLIGNPWYLKLGTTKNLNQRLRQLQRWPGELKILHSVPGGALLEKEIHRIARASGPYLGGTRGEWYPPHRKRDLLILMDSHTKKPQIQDTVIAACKWIVKTIKDVI